MFMVESHQQRDTRVVTKQIKNGFIIMISGEDLLSECITDILSRNFIDRKIIQARSVYELEPADIDASQLVLLYRPRPEDANFIIERFEQNAVDASVGIVVDSLDAAESLLRCLPDNDVIDGVVPLDMRLDVFIATIHLLMKGGEHFPSALLQRLRRTTSEQPKISATPEKRSSTLADYVHPALPAGELALTTREIQILDLLCKGTQNKIIADRLQVSENTVKVHIRNIYKKMRVRNRTEAASRFFALDLKGTPRTPDRN